MGHDIYGVSKAGNEVAYARFSMGNYNASILYSLLDANEFHAGVSGSGGSSTFTIEQMEKAMDAYKQLFSHIPLSEADWDLKQILMFIENCLETAHKDGSVSVYFG
ncbi:hypothetical protein DS745_07075 [Anaerobacillus alkaliphilus]|uniref:Uncharacterized protein n=1 Tax=Anaerobacillus alkaliphilus TaxID=1548597 RepID=A0A4Q0VVP1_9BACI|nr:hypothetical protein [Anaerobacillus alkaliphilus]RXJ02455.1 hypothetical protein DS745_07075 [Anaerobacillus alkaliphilus]